MPGMGYTILTLTPTNDQGMPSEPGAINGGMFARQPDLATPVVTNAVDDMDAALGQVRSWEARWFRAGRL